MAIVPFLRRNSRTLIIILTPLVFLPLPIVLDSSEAKCAYGLILMAVYWTTEAFPLAVTAMLPIIIFPMMGVSKVKTLAREYYTDITFVFLGGLSVAIAIEKWKVHRRFALKLLLLMGSNPKWLMLGFMLTTSFLSMWVSNTATTSMMIPIAQAVLVQLFKTKELKKFTSVPIEEDNLEADKNHEVKIIQDNGNYVEMNNDHDKQQKQSLTSESNDENDNFDFKSLNAADRRLCKAVCLCICYAANCGGVGTLTGTGPNLVMKGQADLLAGGRSGITFLTWFIFSFPVAFINVFITWFVLQIMFFGWRQFFRSSKDESTAAADIIQKEYEKLGRITFAEKAVIGHFVILVLLWFTLEPEFAPGWGSFFPHGYVGDAVPAIIILFMLFIFPSQRRNNRGSEIPPLLNWQVLVERLPWGVQILLGGGFALARACRESGLSVWLAGQLSVFSAIPPWAMVMIICIIVSFSTEVTSNTAICTIYMPILAELAVGIRVHPIYIMLPSAISTSFAFMLPVATPPNTIVFSYGYLKVIDMVKIGFVLNLLCVIVVTIAINTWGRAYFNLDEFPDWPGLKQTVLMNNTTGMTYFNNLTSYINSTNI